MIEEEKDDENSNKDKASLNLRERQNKNPSIELIHFLVYNGSGCGYEMTESKIIPTPYEPLPIHKTLTAPLN